MNYKIRFANANKIGQAKGTLSALMSDLLDEYTQEKLNEVIKILDTIEL